MPENQAPATPGQMSLEDFIRTSGMQPTTPPPAPAPQQIDIPETTIIEKPVRVHGFFRTLTIIALVVVGFLMLAEALDVFSLQIGNFNFTLLYPVVVILSAIVIWSYRGIFGKLFGLLLFLGVVGGFFGINVYTSLNPRFTPKEAQQFTLSAAVQ